MQVTPALSPANPENAGVTNDVGVQGGPSAAEVRCCMLTLHVS
jgi:hypothetical protein